MHLRARFLIAASVACLNPTEVMVDVTTNVPCSGVLGTTISVGAPGDESAPVAARTTNCDATGDIGTLAILPSGAGNLVGIRVTLGVTTPPDDCADAGYFGCIVARRTIFYATHQRLDLPIELDEDCENVACSATTTCVHHACVDAGATCDPGAPCSIADAGTPPATIACGQPMLVVANAPPTAPRLAKTPTGYAIAWDNAAAGTSRAARVVAFDAVAIGSPVTLTALGPNALIGPFAADAANYALLTSDSALSFNYVPANGSAAPTTFAVPEVTAVLTRSGLFSDAAHTGFVFASFGIGGQVERTTLTLPTLGTAAIGIGATGVSGNFALDVSTSTFLAMFSPQCTLSSFASTSFALVGQVVLQPASCTVAIPAGLATSEALAYQDAATDKVSVMTFDIPVLSPRLASPAIVGISDPDALAFMTTSTKYRAVTSSGKKIVGSVIDDPSGAVTNTTLVTTVGADGRVWDAVSDGPGLDSFGVVWYATTPTPGYWFERFCN